MFVHQLILSQNRNFLQHAIIDSVVNIRGTHDGRREMNRLIVDFLSKLMENFSILIGNTILFIMTRTIKFTNTHLY